MPVGGGCWRGGQAEARRVYRRRSRVDSSVCSGARGFSDAGASACSTSCAHPGSADEAAVRLLMQHELAGEAHRVAAIRSENAAVQGQA